MQRHRSTSFLRDPQIAESDKAGGQLDRSACAAPFWRPCSLDSVRSNGDGDSSSVGCTKRTPFRSQVLPMGAMQWAV